MLDVYLGRQVTDIPIGEAGRNKASPRSKAIPLAGDVFFKLRSNLSHLLFNFENH